MWIFTTIGFYSVVAHNEIEGVMLVRGRVREDMEALQAYGEEHGIPVPEIIENAGTDYRFRIFIAKRHWDELAAHLVADIDYPNFKAAVKYGRSVIYHQVWALLRRQL